MSDDKKPFNLKQNITFYEQVVVSRTMFLEDIIGCPITEIAQNGSVSRIGIICRNRDNTKVYIEWQGGPEYDNCPVITAILDVKGNLTKEAREVFNCCKIGGE